MTTTKLSELTGDYVLDNAHSRIGFQARHAMVTKVRGQFDDFDIELIPRKQNKSADALASGALSGLKK